MALSMTRGTPETGTLPMNSPSPVPARMIITIDGPAGTGKTSVAHELAARLGLDSLDTGAMYRAIALVSIEKKIDPEDADEIAQAASASTLDFDWSQTPPQILLDGQVVGDRLREEDVDERVSIVAGNARVREELVKAQRAIAASHPRLVTEGRDQGSVVFPDAEMRFYLDARPVVRAERRVDQLRATGQVADLKEVLHSIEARDRRDETRHDSPLQIPEGAIMIDTSDMSLEEVVDQLEAAVRERAAGSESGT